jgi:hypothetical protein
MFGSPTNARPKVDELRAAKFQTGAGVALVLVYVVAWLVTGKHPRGVAPLAMGTMFLTAGCVRLRRTGVAPGIMRAAAIVCGAAAIVLFGLLLYQTVVR